LKSSERSDEEVTYKSFLFKDLIYLRERAQAGGRAVGEGGGVLRRLPAEPGARGRA